MHQRSILAAAVCGSVFAAIGGCSSESPSASQENVGTSSAAITTGASLGKSAGTLASEASRSHARPHGPHGSLGRHGSSRKKPPTYTPGTGLVLPHWSPTFTAPGGQEYTLAALGTDPSLGTSTTIPTVIIPYRLVFADGSVIDASQDLIDGTTAVNGLVDSPLFQPTPWSAGGKQLGTTQWGDAVMRSNYWKQQPGGANGVTTKGNYHVLFGQPTIEPVVTVNVPAQYGDTVLNPNTGRYEGAVDAAWLNGINNQEAAAFGITPSEIVIYVTGEVIGDFLNGGGFLGYHEHEDLSSLTGIQGDQVQIVTSYWGAQSSEGSRGALTTEVFAHEVAETFNDPTTTNLVPAWEINDHPHECYSPILEVADPLEYVVPSFQATLNGRSFPFPDFVFTPWFFGGRGNYSVNGQYDFLGQVHTSATECKDPGFLSTYFSGQGAGFPYDVIFTDVNNTKQAVGYLASGGVATYGFAYTSFDIAAGIVDGFEVVSVPVPNLPGYVWDSAANGINDAGVIVGAFADEVGTHGFEYNGGTYTTIDFPGAIATVALGINSRTVPDVVGQYVDAAGVGHGFILRNGKYTSIDAPGATNASVNGINDHRQIVVSAVDANGISHGFEGRFARSDDTCPATLSSLDYPMNASDYTTQVSTSLSSINNNDEIVGSVVATYPGNTTSAFGVFESGGSFLSVSGGSVAFDGSYSTVMSGINDADIAVGSANDPIGNIGEVWIPFSEYTGPTGGGASGLSDDTPGSTNPPLPYPSLPATLPSVKH